MYGEPMIYGITIINNAPNREIAEQFVAYLLDPEGGQVIMERNGQPSVIPSFTRSFDHVPEQYKKFVTRDN